VKDVVIPLELELVEVVVWFGSVDTDDDDVVVVVSTWLKVVFPCPVATVVDVRSLVVEVDTDIVDDTVSGVVSNVVVDAVVVVGLKVVGNLVVIRASHN
jgi:hypothetical protein